MFPYFSLEPRASPFLKTGTFEPSKEIYRTIIYIYIYTHKYIYIYLYIYISIQYAYEIRDATHPETNWEMHK